MRSTAPLTKSKQPSSAHGPDHVLGGLHQRAVALLAAQRGARGAMRRSVTSTTTQPRPRSPPRPPPGSSSRASGGSRRRCRASCRSPRPAAPGCRFRARWRRNLSTSSARSGHHLGYRAAHVVLDRDAVHLGERLVHAHVAQVLVQHREAHRRRHLHRIEEHPRRRRLLAHARAPSMASTASCARCATSSSSSAVKSPSCLSDSWIRPIGEPSAASSGAASQPRSGGCSPASLPKPRRRGAPRAPPVSAASARPSPDHERVDAAAVRARRRSRARRRTCRTARSRRSTARRRRRRSG